MARRAEHAANWPAERLVAIWNSLPGVVPVESFKTNKAANTMEKEFHLFRCLFWDA